MGFELFIGHAEYELQTAERQLNLMLNRWVDGLIVLGNFSGGANMVKSLQSPNTPIVSIASGTNTNLPFVDFDQTQGAILALNYLFKLNHRKIAFIGNDQISGVNERLNTYREFMKSNLLDIPVEYINDNVLTSSQAQIYTRKLLSLPLPPTALFCASDVIALGAMSGAWQMGWQIPKDLSIIGYDDITEAKDAYIPLTTIKQPASLAAKKAVEMLLNLINSPSDSSGCKSKILQPQLVIRESCFGPKDHTID